MWINEFWQMYTIRYKGEPDKPHWLGKEHLTLLKSVVRKANEKNGNGYYVLQSWQEYYNEKGV